MVDRRGKPAGEGAVEFHTTRAGENFSSSSSVKQDDDESVSITGTEKTEKLKNNQAKKVVAVLAQGENTMDKLDNLVEALVELEKRLNGLEADLEVCSATYKKSMEMLQSESLYRDVYDYVDNNAYQDSKIFLKKLREKIVSQDLVVVKNARQKVETFRDGLK